jgi:hypothetical protein
VHVKLKSVSVQWWTLRTVSSVNLLMVPEGAKQGRPSGRSFRPIMRGMTGAVLTMRGARGEPRNAPLCAWPADATLASPVLRALHRRPAALWRTRRNPPFYRERASWAAPFRRGRRPGLTAGRLLAVRWQSLAGTRTRSVTGIAGIGWEAAP